MLWTYTILSPISALGALKIALLQGTHYAERTFSLQHFSGTFSSVFPPLLASTPGGVEAAL